MKKYLLVIVTSVLCGAAFAQTTTPPSQGVLDTILTHFISASTGQMGIAQGFAKKIFIVLAGFDLSLFALRKVLSSGDLSDWIGGAALKIFTYGFFWTLIQMAPSWIPLITQSFISMGTTISGGGAVITPSGVIDQGIAAALQIWNAWSPSINPFSWGNDFIMGLTVVLSMIFTLIGFMLVSLQLLMTQIEFTLVSGVGILMLGFSGATFTTMFSEKYFGYIVSTGLKLMFIFVIAGLGTQISQLAAAAITSWQAAGTFSPLLSLTLSIVMLMYGVLGLQVPAIAGALMNGSPSMSAGGIAGGAAAVAGGVAGAAMAGAGAAAGIASAGGSVADFARESLDKLSVLTGGGGDVRSTMGDNFDRLASLTGANGGGDSIGNPSASSFGSSADSGQPSSFKDGLGRMGDAQSKMGQHEGGGGSGVSIRFNHLGD